jgi:hypothetical protein
MANQCFQAKPNGLRIRARAARCFGLAQKLVVYMERLFDTSKYAI